MSRAKKKGRRSGPVRQFSERQRSRPSGGDAATRGDPIDPEDEDRPESRTDEARRLTRTIQVKRLPDESAEERADDTEENRDDDSTGIATRHDELRDDPDDQTEEDPTENAHDSSFPDQKKSNRRAIL
jgi:hypothetical protein